MRILLLAVGVISLTARAHPITVLGAPRFVIHSHDPSVEMSAQGQVVRVLVGKEMIRRNIHGQTELNGCRVQERDHHDRFSA